MDFLSRSSKKQQKKRECRARAFYERKWASRREGGGKKQIRWIKEPSAGHWAQSSVPNGLEGIAHLGSTSHKYALILIIQMKLRRILNGSRRSRANVGVSVPVVRVLQLNGNTTNSPKLVADLTRRASDKLRFLLRLAGLCGTGVSGGFYGNISMQGEIYCWGMFFWRVWIDCQERRLVPFCSDVRVKTPQQQKRMLLF